MWVAATYLLEGARQTLLRPEAQRDRFMYAVVANLGAGLVLPLWTLRVLPSPRAAVPLLSPCGSAPCTAISVAAAALIGLMMLAPTWSMPRDISLHLNVFSQVLPTSMAEVVVCWVLAGAAVDAALRDGSLAAGAVRWLGSMSWAYRFDYPCGHRRHGRFRRDIRLMTPAATRPPFGQPSSPLSMSLRF